MQSKAMVLWKKQTKMTLVFLLGAGIKRNSVNETECQTHTRQNSAVFVC